MPDTSTEVAIATTTLASPATTITLSGIPSTYTDLRLVITQAGSSTIYGRPQIQFNSDSGSNYGFISLVGDNAGNAVTGNFRSTASIAPSNYYAGSGVALVTYDIFSYKNTSVNKSVLGTASFDQNSSSGSAGRVIGLWRSTSAITSITIIHPSGAPETYSTGTTVTLFGIL